MTHIGLPELEQVPVTHDCKHCSYRYWVAKIEHIHVCKEDCEHYGTDFCKDMNDPEAIKYMKELVKYDE